MAEKALFYALKNDAGVSALVGTGVYGLRAPEGTPKPYVVFQRVATDPVAATDGNDSLIHYRHQVDCYDTSYAGARALAAEVKRAVLAMSGTINGVSGIKTLALSDSDDFGEKTDTFRVRQDFSIWAEE